MYWHKDQEDQLLRCEELEAIAEALVEVFNEFESEAIQTLEPAEQDFVKRCVRDLFGDLS